MWDIDTACKHVFQHYIEENRMSKIGDLYLTNGNRIVLNKGSGEYFDETDILLFSEEQLTRGIQYSTFMKKMNKLKVE